MRKDDPQPSLGNERVIVPQHLLIGNSNYKGKAALTN